MYELQIRTERDDETWCYIIDALSGKMLEQYSRTIYSQAYAYLRHPGLDASYTTINPLPNLSNNGYIQGTYAYVLNKDANDGYSEAYNANNDFRYATDNTHFDEANLYYHIDRIASYFSNLGFNSFTQIIAHAHHDFYDDLDNDGQADDPSPNAAYDPGDHHLRFSDGQGVSGFNSFAREDKIIYHEYTHAVTDFVADLYYNSNYPTESAAIHEGNSDYFAASFTGRYLIGEYACPSYQRNITDPIISSYSGYQARQDYPNVEPHDGGELWSACLWDLRSNLTASVADEIIFFALYDDVPTTLTFLQYRQKIIDSDILINNGCHVNTIKHIFYLWGIGSDAESVTLSGILASNQTWYCTQTLQNDVFVPSGVTLTISSVATVKLVNGSNRYSIISTGGTITNNGTIDSLRARLEANTALRGYCGSIQTAANYANNDNEIVLTDGNFNENVSISNKSDLTISGGSLNNTHFGTLTLTNCDYFYGHQFGAKSVYINQADYAMINNIDAYGTNQSTIGFYLYNSDATANNILADYSQVGVSCYDGSEAEIDESWLSNNLRGIDSYNGSNVNVENTYFCGTALDLKTYNSSSIYAYSCYFDGGTPSTSGSNIYHYSNQNCSSYKISPNRQTENKDYVIVTNEDKPGGSEFDRINSAYFALNKKLSNALKEKTDISKEAFSIDYEKVIEDFKKFISNNPDSPLANIALIASAKSYRRIDDLRGKDDFAGMKIFLTDIIENKEYSSLKPQAERLMIDYYRLTGNLKAAIETADKLIENYKDSPDYVCGVLYAKGLIFSHDLNQPDKAAESFSYILRQYPENGLAALAENELRILGQEVGEQISVEAEIVGNEIESNNYPNPFNPTTTISYSLPEAGNVQIKVYDVLGREIAKLVDETKSAGKHTVAWNGSNNASGIYFYTITFNNQTLYKKMLKKKKHTASF